MHVKSIAWQEESLQEVFKIITESKYAQENQTLMEIVSAWWDHWSYDN